MNGKDINFDNKNIKKSDFYNKIKKMFNTDNIDVNKKLVSKKKQYDKYNSSKYFIGNNDNGLIRSLYLFLSQATGYVNKFDKNKITMSLLIKDIQLLKKQNKIWKKIEKFIKIDFNTKTTYGDDDKYIKTEIKTHKDSIITNFYNKEGSKNIPKEKIPHKCLSVTILDSIIFVQEKYYSQVFLE